MARERLLYGHWQAGARPGYHVPMRTRAAFTLIELMMVIMIIGVLIGLAAPAYERYKQYTFTRTCYANQKTISSALQAYNLDHNEKRTDYPTVLQTLSSGGYIRMAPDDPGVGAGSSGDYQATSVGHGVTCKVHGPLL